MEPTIKSKKSTERVYIRFVNKSGRFADIIWVNFEGSPVHYDTLAPDSYLDIDTFTHHPWMFEDHITRDKLAVFNEFYFFPPSLKKLFRPFFKDTINVENHRIVVMISVPVYSLKERSLQVVRDYCLDNEKTDILKHCEEELPKSVYDDLMLLLLRKDRVYVN